LSTAEELGERKIIKLILDQLDQMPNMSVPFGDDVSAIDIEKEKLAIIKTDMLVGKTDVPPGMTLQQAARKTVVMNISDLAAKGVQPLAMLASIGVPRNLTIKDVQKIGKGLNEGAREYNTYVIGGDTNEASDLIINCLAFGICEKRHLIRRSGAKPGDIVAVTGLFGKTSSGLKILLEDFSAPLKLRKELVNAVYVPHAQLKEGLALAQTQAATALSVASNVGFLIDNLPVASETKQFAKIHRLDSAELSLYGGEEYELLVTIKPRLWEKTKKAVEHVGASLIKIGVVTKEKKMLLNVEGKRVPIEVRGWEHFKTA
jgi:thiamine-monophosphate kinase